MATKVFNMEGGLHSAAAYSAFENRAYGNCVASTDSFVVTAGSGMNAQISAGDGLISVNANLARRIQSDAQETVAVAAASTSYSRIDSVVAYIDTAVTPTTSVVDNTNGILKFASIAGTAASSPQAPNQAAIQSAIGAGNPYMVLYDITVPSNVTNLTSATFADRRKLFNTIPASRVTYNDWLAFNPEPTGYSGSVTIVGATYTVIGNMAYVKIQSITGNSNSATFGITLPVQPKIAIDTSPMVVIDGGARKNGRALSNGNKLLFSSDYNYLTNFATSGQKGMLSLEIFYEVNIG